MDVVPLDITDPSSIESATKHIEQRYDSSINVLINNAGIAFKPNQFGKEIVKKTLNTNFYGTVNVTKALCPFVSDRIMFISSKSGALKQYSKERQQQFLSEDLSEDSLSEMVREFESDAAPFQNGSGDINDEIAMERMGWTLVQGFAFDFTLKRECNV